MEISHLKDIIEAYKGLIAFMKHKFRPQSVLDLNQFVILEKECTEIINTYEDFLTERERLFEERKEKLAEAGLTTLDDLKQGLKNNNIICENLINRLEELNNTPELELK